MIFWAKFSLQLDQKYSRKLATINYTSKGHYPSNYQESRRNQMITESKDATKIDLELELHEDYKRKNKNNIIDPRRQDSRKQKGLERRS